MMRILLFRFHFLVFLFKLSAALRFTVFCYSEFRHVQPFGACSAKTWVTVSMMSEVVLASEGSWVRGKRFKNCPNGQTFSL